MSARIIKQAQVSSAYGGRNGRRAAFYVVLALLMTFSLTPFQALAYAAPPKNPLTVTQNLIDVTVAEGADATFTVVASGSPVPTAIWYSCADGENWIAVTEGTSQDELTFTLTVPAVTQEQNGTQYYATLTNTGGSISTSIAMLTVEAAAAIVHTGVRYDLPYGTYYAPYRVVYGEPIRLSGTGWLNPAGDDGAVFAIELDPASAFDVLTTRDISSPCNGAVLPNKAVYGAVQANKQGEWEIEIPFPTVENSNLGLDEWIEERWQAGSAVGHTVALISQSRGMDTLIPGAPAQLDRLTIAYYALFTVVDEIQPYAPVRIKNPTKVTVAATAEASFTATAAGEPTPTAQWQQSADGETWSDIPGATDYALVIKNTTVALSGMHYHAVFTNSQGSITTDAATLTVEEAVAPAVSKHPSDTTVSAGNDAVFQASVSGKPTPTAQWQQSVDGETWNNVNGATATKITVPAVTQEQSGTHYRAVFTNSQGSVTTDAAMLTVEAAKPEPTDPTLEIQTGGQTGNAVELLGEYPTIWSDGEGVRRYLKLDASHLSSDASYLFYLDGEPAQAISPEETLKPATLATDAAGSGSGTVAISTRRVAKGTARFGSVWTYYLAPGIHTIDVREPDGTTAVAQVQFQALQRPQASISTGSLGALLAGSTISVGGQGWLCKNGDGSVFRGATVRLTLQAADGQVPTFAGSATLAESVAAYYTGAFQTDLTLPSSGLADGWYRIRAISGVSYGVSIQDDDREVLSEWFAIGTPEGSAPSAALAITTQPQPYTALTAGEQVTLSSEASGTGLSYQWERYDHASLTWLPLSGANEASYSYTTSSNTPDLARFRVKVTDSLNATVRSNTAVVNVRVPEGQPTVTVWQSSASGGEGASINVYGSGWTETDGSASEVAIKIDNGAYAHTADNGVAEDMSVWAVVQTDENGDFTTDYQVGGTYLSLSLPNGTTAGASGSVPAFPDGVHTLTCVSGVGDTLRAATSNSFTVTTTAAVEPAVTVAPSAELGGTLHISGVGFVHPTDTTEGSRIAIKLDTGFFHHTEEGAIHSNLSVWAIIAANADGSFEYDVPMPDGTDAGINGSTPALAAGGTHTLHFLTGSLKAGDYVRSLSSSEFTVTERSTPQPPPGSPGSAPIVTTHPGDVTAVAGTSATFTAAASGEPAPSVQWYTRTSEADTWASISEATSLTLTLNVARLAQSGSQYMAVFVNDSGLTQTNVATLTVTPASDPSGGEGAPVISTQPVSVLLEPSALSASFTAAASGATLVKWQSSDDDGATWIDIQGADAVTLEIPAASAVDGTQYRAIFANANGEIASTAAVLYRVPTQGYEQITTGQAGMTLGEIWYAPITVQAGGEVVLYGTGWKHPDGRGSGIVMKFDDTIQQDPCFASVTTGVWRAVYTLPDAWTPGSSPHWFRLLTGSTLSGDTLRSTRSSAVSIAAAAEPSDSAPVVTTRPQDVAVAVGATATFTVVASGKPTPTVQWYTRAAGTESWADIEGATLATLTLDPAVLSWSGSQYMAVIRNSMGMAMTSAATLAVSISEMAPVVTHHPAAQTVAVGTTATFTALATGIPAPSVQWQYRDPNGTSWANVVNATSTSTTLTVTNAATAFNGRVYRAVFTNGVGSAAISNSALLTVTGTDDPPPQTGGPTVKITTQAEMGGTIHITGAGFQHPDGSGSRVAIKIDDGAFAHTAEGKVNDNTSVWLIVDAISDGSFSCDLLLPDGTETGARGSLPAFTEGVHTLRFLTGSLKAGDTVRTVESSRFIVGKYAPPASIKPIDPAAALSGSLAGRISASISKGQGGILQAIVTLPGTTMGDWVHLSAYYEQAASLQAQAASDGFVPLAFTASVRYPWGEGAAASFQVDKNSRVSSALAVGAFDEPGTYYIVARDANFDGADDPVYPLLGWTTYTVEAEVPAPEETPNNNTKLNNPSTDTSSGSSAGAGGDSIVNNYYNSGGAGGVSSTTGTAGYVPQTGTASAPTSSASRLDTAGTSSGLTSMSGTGASLADATADATFLMNIILFVAAGVVAAVIALAIILLLRSRRRLTTMRA
ncbi:MAG: hypothetical protein LBU07_07680 [Coriobacteriales bacterium]|jgi:hypothetical protein|nr:hypothetical protein [Coriobacteriales bacterium]